MCEIFYEIETGQKSSGVVDQGLDHLVVLEGLVEQGDVVDPALHVVGLRVRILMKVLTLKNLIEIVPEKLDI